MRVTGRGARQSAVGNNQEVFSEDFEILGGKNFIEEENRKQNSGVAEWGFELAILIAVEVSVLLFMRTMLSMF